MKLTIERLPESRVQMEITAEEQESAEAWKRAARKVGNQITVPGFRKGKAPRSMIERLYGPEIFEEEAHRYLMTDLYRQALEEQDVVPVGDPEVDIVSTDPLSFTVIVPIFPEVDPGNYQDVRVEPRDAAVDDAAIDEFLQDLRKAHSPWVDAQSEGLQVGAGLELTPKSRYPRAGDQVTIDYTVQDESGPAEEPEIDAVFVVGESGLLEPIEDAIKGLRVGETAGFSVPFAEDDETVDEELRGKSLNYTVTLKGIKERDLIPLDDDFAKAAGDVDTLDELKADLRESMHRSRTSTARSEALSEIIAKMVAGAAIELPAPMVDRALNDDLERLKSRLVAQGASLDAYLRAMDMTEEAFRESRREGVALRLRNSLFLQKIAEKEGIAVDDTDVDAAVERLVASAAEADSPRQTVALWRSDNVRHLLEDEMFERKLWDRLVELATEGRGVVINGWEPTAVTAIEETAAGGESAATADGAAADDDAVTSEA